MQIGYVHTHDNGNLYATLNSDFLMEDYPWQASFHAGTSLFEFTTMDTDGLRQIFLAFCAKLEDESNREESAVWCIESLRTFAQSNLYLYLFVQSFMLAALQDSWDSSIACLRELLPAAPVLKANLEVPSDIYGSLSAIVFDILITTQRNLSADLNALFTADSFPPTATALQRYYLLGKDGLHFEVSSVGLTQILSPDKPLESYEDSTILAELTANSINLRPAYVLTRVTDLIAVDLLTAVLVNVPVKKCLNCGGLFVPRGRSDTEYCERIYQNGKRCSEVGAALCFQKRHQDDRIQSTYLTAYRRMDSRTRQSSDLSKEQFKTWGTQARELRQQCRDGKISFEVFAAWLDESTQKRS